MKETKLIESPLTMSDLNENSPAIDKLFPYSRKNPETGKPTGSLDNYVIFIRCHASISSKLRYNLFNHAIEWEGLPITDAAYLNIQRIMECKSSLKITKQNVVDAIQSFSVEEASYDPILEKLLEIVANKSKYEHDTGLTLHNWLPRVLNMESNNYLELVGYVMVRHIIHRQLKPGSDSRLCFSLIGGQDLGKSKFPGTLIKPLCPPGSQYGEELVRIPIKDLDHADTRILVNSGIICLFDEGASIRKAEIDKAKSFISTTEDVVRAPYGRTMETFKRRFVCFLTENRMQFLSDSENARFLPIELKVQYDWTLLEKINASLLIEAYEEEMAGIPMPFIPKSLLIEMQQDYIDGDPWEDIIETSLLKDLTYQSGGDNYFISYAELFAIISNKNVDEVDMRMFGGREKNRIGKVMERIGLDKFKKSNARGFKLSPSKIKELRDSYKSKPSELQDGIF